MFTPQFHKLWLEESNERMQLIPSDEFVVVDADILCFGATDGKTEK